MRWPLVAILVIGMVWLGVYIGGDGAMAVGFILFCLGAVVVNELRRTRR